ncbi:fatty acid desaturase 5 [Striga asiatica]|uniref:Fatty acid desaturase 5 n=1 Tax=Striga asiatica TaxID=4170 RepID=A0A5A7QTR5_STRAF|nr:fatty acid desaturase 5 [Striga asiatica]
MALLLPPPSKPKPSQFPHPFFTPNSSKTTYQHKNLLTIAVNKDFTHKKLKNEIFFKSRDIKFKRVMPIVNAASIPLSGDEKKSNFGRILLSDVVVERKRDVFGGRKWNSLDVATIGVVIAMHLLCVFAPFAFNWGALWVAVGLYVVTGLLGITLSFHRNLSHRSFKLPKWLEYLFAYCGVQALQICAAFLGGGAAPAGGRARLPSLLCCPRPSVLPVIFGLPCLCSPAKWRLEEASTLVVDRLAMGGVVARRSRLEVSFSPFSAQVLYSRLSVRTEDPRVVPLFPAKFVRGFLVLEPVVDGDVGCLCVGREEGWGSDGLSELRARAAPLFRLVVLDGRVQALLSSASGVRRARKALWQFRKLSPDLNYPLISTVLRWYGPFGLCAPECHFHYPVGSFTPLGSVLGGLLTCPPTFKLLAACIQLLAVCNQLVAAFCTFVRYHHQFCDTEKDPHSPLEGFWFSHMSWLFDTNTVTERCGKPNNVGDLEKQPFYKFLQSTYIIHPLALGALLYALGGFPYIVWGMGVRIVWVYHITWLVNSACHVWGRQAWKTGDLSRNNWWVAVLAFGEGWHNNHHAFEYSARHGLEWWQIDMTWYVVGLLKDIGLATDVKLPAKAHKEKMAFAS